MPPSEGGEDEGHEGAALGDLAGLVLVVFLALAEEEDGGGVAGGVGKVGGKEGAGDGEIDGGDGGGEAVGGEDEIDFRAGGGGGGEAAAELGFDAELEFGGGGEKAEGVVVALDFFTPPCKTTSKTVDYSLPNCCSKRRPLPKS